MRTTARVLAGAITAALLAGCGTATTIDGGAAAVANGISVPRDQLEDAVRELVGDVEGLSPELRAMTVTPTQQRILQLQIQSAIVASVVEDHGLVVGSAEEQQVRDDILTAVGGQEQLEAILADNGLTQALFDDLIVPQEARIVALLEAVGREQLDPVLLEALDAAEIAIAPGLGEWDPVSRSVVQGARVGTGAGGPGLG